MSAQRDGSMRSTLLAIAVVLLGWLTGCDDTVTPPPPPPPQSGELILSNPGAARAAGAGSSAEIVYVSLVPGTVEEGRLAEITNGRSGATSRTAMADGGFDPIPIAAAAGDTIRLRIDLVGGGTTQLSSYVPFERRPSVVRTSPPRGKRDVVLNAPIRIVFSEPIDPSTVTTTSVRLDGNGGTVGGEVTVSGDGLRAELRPFGSLAPNASYTLAISTGVADLDGEFAEQTVEVQFSTGATNAVATAYTDPAAFYVVSAYAPLNGRGRTAEFDGILHDDGRFTGRFDIYYADEGLSSGGMVVCFSISGDTTWVSGVIDESHRDDWLGETIGWFVVDNGRPENGIPDGLSLATIGLAAVGWGTPRDHCDSRPTAFSSGTEKIVQDVEVGDIVVTGTTPAPAPPPSPAHLVFAVQPWNTIVGRAFLPAIEVRALDDTRARTADYDGPVGIALSNNPGGAELGGATTVTAQDGVAHFGNLTVDAPASGYTLVVTALGLTGETSTPFDVIEVSGGRIAFHDEAGIHVMNADGSSVTTLVDDLADGAFSHTQPAWSPDGQRVAFRSSRDGNSDIYVVNVDGSGLTRLTTDPALDDSPEWSPDGQRIVFGSERRAGIRGGGEARPDIYVMSADGSGVLRVTNDAARDVNPTFSPDGARIAFASDRHAPGGDMEIYVMNADGSGITRLTQSTGTKDLPDWSPDGTRIAYHGSGVYVMNSDGTGVTRVAAAGGAPAWSPDGLSIAYSARYLLVMNADGSGKVVLPSEGSGPDWTPTPSSAPAASALGRGR